MSDGCLMQNEDLLSTMSWREQFSFHWDDDGAYFVLGKGVYLGFILLAQWNESSKVVMSIHKDTLLSLWVNQSLPLLCNAVCQARKQHKHVPVFQFRPGLNPRSSTLGTIMLTITQPRRFSLRGTCLVQKQKIPE